MPHLSGWPGPIMYHACAVLVVWSSLLPRGWWSPLPVIKEEDNVPIFTGEIEKDFKGWGKKVTIVKQNQYGLGRSEKRNIC